ncbi:MAG: hypothetical protein A3D65_02160 [Candidatus Lloydbacteria bacterium RIFCSPHIGHO2_02_FULL_50_13]|uniref:Uncharacterized protein n=1 Tax=Candidatus Lloydbacteria bacterium RIFCSPHIGHO2_02_FULL_50_13 TaxID=1798661 RepID=A0A1G2D3F2_9BACT|nr:MAG: hypothetical protein A3D65_02160 [Candidatus Lloydbacteria bacterium RIFCSPHIGHO2_02_FULL_50_13]
MGYTHGPITYQKAYFVGVGGIGVSALVWLFASRGAPALKYLASIHPPQCGGILDAPNNLPVIYDYGQLKKS